MLARLGPMTVIDIVFAVVILLSVLWGLWRGLTRELVSMIAWVAIAVLAYRYAALVGVLLPFDAPRFVHVAVGVGIIIVLCVIAAAIVGRLLRAAVAASQLAGADRVLGAVFGALRGSLVVLLITWVVVEGGFSESHVWRNSASGPYLEHVWHWMAGTMPNRRVPLVMLSGG
jgi:membrane protein required for colicin V production